ncbi:MAG: ABC transporter permease [Oscillospiraceae bacterium]|nr:ABC transporter permease [Oscillospiraceae bacterium]
MKNPLTKRLPKELKSELGKYIVLFVFITGMIALVSGYLVAGKSMMNAYNESFDKYNIEDGNFESFQQLNSEVLKTLEEEQVEIYENFYIEENVKNNDSTLRLFSERKEVNKVCIMDGNLPENPQQIAIDRVYAKNNEISVGDTLTVGEKDFEVTGFVALSDYSTLYQNPSDMMFDAIKFGVAVLTDEGFDSFTDSNMHYSYSWTYNTPPADDIEAKTMSEDFLEVLSQNTMLTNYLPAYTNQAIQMAGNDMDGDTQMMAVLLYMMMAIIAFIFAITTSNTIMKESAVIGTLRASGYTKAELIRHYMTMPMIITLLSAVAGNILGYTALKEFAINMYYNSFSLTTYKTLWNGEAFVMTSVVPLIMMFIINFLILAKKMKLSPLKFIRRDLSTRKKKKAFKLNTKINILTRFRLRVIFQNIPNYITIIVGIVFANLILLFGCGLEPLIDHYSKEITSNMISDYQYILKAPLETENPDAEKFYANSLKVTEKSEEGVNVYGIVPDSRYIDLDLTSEGIYISNAYAEKYGINEGDTVKLRGSYDETEYSFEVDGIYYYPSTIAVFMSDSIFCETFDIDAENFAGYFSSTEITDIEKMYIATEITEEDLTKTSRQMKNSFDGMGGLLSAFGIIIFMLIIYMLSKIIIEKNAQSVSMTKILGYSDREINSLYITTTSIVVIASLILTMPLVSIFIDKVMDIALSGYSGYLPFYVPFSVYVKMVALGVVSYAVIAFMQMRRIKKVPLDIALKNVE